MSDISKALKEVLDRRPAAPFLFIGSGFSRRYLGLNDWSGLLARFCQNIKPFGYYHAKADGDLPATASYIALDYNEWWWQNPHNATERSKTVLSSSDALKLDISAYMASFSLEDARKSSQGAELAELSNVVVDGVITTNWDLLLDEVFPDYKVFIGQSELLFSNPQAIGEIYKIHGCATSPTSLVLTKEDYVDFTSKNPYLAAKLVTIFVEHPVIFLGYSLNDPHIRLLIASIAQCLTTQKITQFQENLIFVSVVENEENVGLERATIQTPTSSVTMMVAKVHSFQQIYKALTGSTRKIPARILRFLKEQLYELVRSPDNPEKRMAVVDVEQIGSAEAVQFVVGVGVAQRQKSFDDLFERHVTDSLAKKGYSGISPNDLFIDVLESDSRFCAEDLLISAFPGYARTSQTFIPIYRYLRAANIFSIHDLNQTTYEGAKKIEHKIRQAGYTYQAYAKRYAASFANLSTPQIIQKASSPEEAILMLQFQPSNEVDLSDLRQFLLDSKAEIKEQSRITFNKLVCRYDWLKYGFNVCNK